MSAIFELPLALLGLLILMLLLAAAEAGFRLGGAMAARDKTDTDHPEIGTIAAAMLGLLALVIGFTFSMALSRFDGRRGLVIEEANALGATARLAESLPEPQKTRFTALLPAYLKLRLDFFEDGMDEARLAATYRDTAALQARLFAEAQSAAVLAPEQPAYAQLLQALNQAFALEAARRAAFEATIPQSVLWTLLAAASLCAGVLGYSGGLHQRRHLATQLVLYLLLAAVILLIIDLDRPRRGAIRVSQAPMLRVIERIEGAKPNAR